MTDARAQATLRVAAAAFVLVCVLAAWSDPSYSGWRDTVSCLGSGGGARAMVVRASIVAFGSCIAVAAPAIGPLRTGPVVGLLRVMGAAVVAVGLAPKDAPGAVPTTLSQVHVGAAVLAGAALVAALGVVLLSTSPPGARVAAAVTLTVVIAGALTMRLTWGSACYGVVERVILGSAMAWLLCDGAPPLRESGGPSAVSRRPGTPRRSTSRSRWRSAA